MDFKGLLKLSKSTGYEPPWTIDQIRKEHGDKVADRLANDPVHKWRSDTGIELVHREPTKKELKRIIANWKLMTDEQKRLSDEKSKELFGVTNDENAEKLLGEQARTEAARKFVADVRKMALKRKLNFFLVTDGASGISNNGNPAVRNARDAQIKWELENGSDPYEDWSKKAQAVDHSKWPNYDRWQNEHHDKSVDQARKIIKEYYSNLGKWGLKDSKGRTMGVKYVIDHGDKATSKGVIRSAGELDGVKRVNCHEMAAVILDRLQRNRIAAKRVMVDKDEYNDVRMGHSTVFFKDEGGRWHRATGGMRRGKKSRLGDFDSLEDAIDQYIAVEKANKQTTDDERVDVYDTTDLPFTDNMPWPEYKALARTGKRIYHQEAKK